MQHFPIIAVVKCEIYRFNYEVENCEQIEQIYKFIGYWTKKIKTICGVWDFYGAGNIVELQFIDDSKSLQKHH